MKWLIGGFTIVALVLIGFVARSEYKTARGEGIKEYQLSDTDKPMLKAESVFKDIGKMRVSDEKTTDFIVQNIGNKPLELFRVTSSCDCTAGQITIRGIKSPEFSMHDKKIWVGVLDPGETATVSVIYRPAVMPVKGEVSRTVSMQTNDPINTQLTFTIKAFVE